VCVCVFCINLINKINKNNKNYLVLATNSHPIHAYKNVFFNVKILSVLLLNYSKMIKLNLYRN